MTDPANRNLPQRLFLSCARRDAAELANHRRVDLAGLGYELWQDTREMREETEWEEQIMNRVKVE